MLKMTYYMRCKNDVLNVPVLIGLLTWFFAYMFWPIQSDSQLI